MKRYDAKNNKTHWKCLEELHEDPQYLVENADEFTPASSSRRDFLKLMGFTLTTASLVACTRSPVHKAIPFLEKPTELTPGVDNWYATTCAGCSAGCSLLVKNRDGRPIKVEGNTLSPMTAGGVCATGQASLLSLYDEKRLKGPVWNGSGVTWERLDAKVREQLASLTQQGKKVVVLTGTVLSPSTKKLIGEFLAPLSHGQHVCYDPISAEALIRTTGEAFGDEVLPSYQFDQAEVIVGINADFLGSWISPVEFTKDYIKNRKLNKKKRLSKHYQIESDYSLTGSNADQRIPIAASQEAQVVAALLHHVAKISGNTLGAAPALNPKLDRQLEAIAQELWQHRGKSLVVSASNNPAVHLGVHGLNQKLENIGTTVDLDNPSLQKQGKESQLASLIEAMGSGEVGTLLIWGVNPAFDNPWAKKFVQALKQVPLSISFSNYLDETASQTKGIAPELNYLEAWTDAQPKKHLYQLAQPLIAPLFDNRAFQDSLLKWMERPGDYYGYLQDYWAREVFPQQFRFLSPKKFWDQSVHDGLFVGKSKPSSTYRLQVSLGKIFSALQEKTAPAQGAFELQLYESIAMRAGQHAGNPWAQELPDPVTKVTWDNYVKMAPQKARELGIRQGDVVVLQSGNEKIKLPVHLQPGMPPNTLAAALGYGRRQAGKVGTAVGKDLYPWVGSEENLFRYTSGPVQLSTTLEKAKLATTQTHARMEGRPIVKETDLASYLRNPHSGNESHVKLISLWPQWETGKEKWGMAIDLNACTGCSACVISCQVENNVPVVGKEEVYRRREMHWMRIDRYYTGDEAAPDAVHQPMFCQHCANAPCETVCPVLATVHSSDGLNQQVYNRCVGTRYCANNCPYKVRRFNWFDYADNPKFDYYLNNDLGKMVLNPDVVVRSRGVMEKCSMCIQRIQAGKLQAKKEGRELKDGDIKMACEQSCPSQAIVFGNLKDENSRVSKMEHDARYYGVLEELNVRPAVGYLTKVRNKG